MVRLNTFILVALVVNLLSCKHPLGTPTTFSPDKNIELNFSVNEDGILSYTVNYKNNIVIDTSSLGFAFKDQPELRKNLRIEKVVHSETREDWETIWGEQRIVKNHYNQLKVDLSEIVEPFRKFSVVFKVYNDGLGFRYEFP
jgi:hypothetical protein